MLREHVTRVADHSHALWTLLVLVVWHDEVLRGRESSDAAATAARARVETRRACK
jgi:hypothetical protein